MAQEEYILGIDEAGRGPVLGPMVYGTCFCPKSKTAILNKMGFADSKVLTAEQREALFELIKQSDILGWKVDSISAQTLSAAMLRRSKYNLNAISHDSAMGLIQDVLDQGVNLTEIYIDTVGIPERYAEKLRRRFPMIPTVVVAKKADSKYPIVSAASICAKVTRDVQLDTWTDASMKNKKVRLSLLPDPFSSDNDSDQSDADRNDGDEQEEEEEDIMEMNDDDFNSTSSHDSSTLKTKTKTKHKTSKKSGKKKEKAAKVVSKFGSGYPGDPQTKKWLKDHFDPVFGYSELVRFSWKTAKVAMEESGVSVDWGDEEEDEAEKVQKQQQRSMSAFLSSSLASSSAKKRHIDVKKRFRYFNDLNVNVTTCF